MHDLDTRLSYSPLTTRYQATRTTYGLLAGPLPLFLTFSRDLAGQGADNEPLDPFDDGFIRQARYCDRTHGSLLDRATGRAMDVLPPEVERIVEQPGVTASS